MDALDARELDVGGRRRPRGERKRPPRRRKPVGQPAERRRDAVDDLFAFDDAEVDVGHERERAAPLARVAVQHETKSVIRIDGHLHIDSAARGASD